MATGNSKTKWNGHIQKTDQIEAAKSDMTLSYIGKVSEQTILSTAPAEIVLLWSAEQVKDNRLYYGDNLHILASLLTDLSVKGHVKLIYIDPPFATNSVFHSRAQADAYQDLLVGLSYVEFIRERLVLPKFGPN